MDAHLNRPGGRRRARAHPKGARIGNNLNQVARWVNTHGSAAEVVAVIAHLVTIERALELIPRPGRQRERERDHGPSR